MAATITQDRSNSSNEKLANSRNLVNQKLEQKMQILLQTVFNQINALYVERISKHAGGKAPGWRVSWSNAFYAAQIKEGIQAAMLGFVSSSLSVVVEEKQMVAISTKADGHGISEVPEEVLESIFFTDPTSTRVDVYFRETSKHITNTYATKVDGIFEKVKNTRIEIGVDDLGNPIYTNVGAVPKELQKQLVVGLEGMSTNYADIVARTGTIWANNEGILGGFRRMGITKQVWYATADERLCPFCAEMDGVVISIESEFVEAGGSVSANTVNAAGDPKTVLMTVPENKGITHPPLHPRCRCTIVAYDLESSINQLFG